MLTALRHPRTDLPWLITLNMIAFAGFHLTLVLATAVWFRRLVWVGHEWLQTFVGLWMLQFWTVGLAVYLVYVFIVSTNNRPAVGFCGILVAYGFFFHSYPLATLLLVLFGQFETYGEFCRSQLPSLDIILNSSKS